MTAGASWNYRVLREENLGWLMYTMHVAMESIDTQEPVRPKSYLIKKVLLIKEKTFIK